MKCSLTAAFSIVPSYAHPRTIHLSSIIVRRSVSTSAVSLSSSSRPIVPAHSTPNQRAATFLRPQHKEDARPAFNTSFNSSENEKPLSSGLPSQLSPEFRARLRGLGIHALTPVQRRALAPVLAGKDVLARAPPGAGKTLAFLLPVLQKYASSRPREPVLWLTPTPELAEQTLFEANRVKPKGFKICVLQKTLPIRSQRLVLREGHHMLIGTPGTVAKLIAQNALVPKSECVVLDEADQLLSRAYRREVDLVLDAVGECRKQTLLFSATMPDWLRDELRRLCRGSVDEGEQRSSAVFEEIQDRRQLNPDIAHFYVTAPKAESRVARLVAWIVRTRTIDESVEETSSRKQAIIFASTRTDCEALASHPLIEALGARQLTAGKSLEERQQTLSSFRRREFSLIIATDLAARGLDLPSVALVLHCSAGLFASRHAALGGGPLSSDVPQNTLGLEKYLHRAGRIRKGGQSVVLVPFSSKSNLAALVSAKQRISHLRSLEKHDRVGARRSRLRRERALPRLDPVSKSLVGLQRQLSIKFSELKGVPSDGELRLAHVRKLAKESLLASSLKNGGSSFVAVLSKQAQFHGGPRMLAAALALLERRKGSTQQFLSPLSGRAGHAPVLLSDPLLGKIQNRQQLMGILRRAMGASKVFVDGENGSPKVETESSDSWSRGGSRRAMFGSGKNERADTRNQFRVGRIALTPRGYVIDMPTENLPRLLGSSELKEKGITPIACANEIPPVVRDERRYRLRIWRDRNGKNVEPRSSSGGPRGEKKSMDSAGRLSTFFRRQLAGGKRKSIANRGSSGGGTNKGKS